MLCSASSERTSVRSSSLAEKSSYSLEAHVRTVQIDSKESEYDTSASKSESESAEAESTRTDSEPASCAYQSQTNPLADAFVDDLDARTPRHIYCLIGPYGTRLRRTIHIKCCRTYTVNSLTVLPKLTGDRVMQICINLIPNLGQIRLLFPFNDHHHGILRPVQSIVSTLSCTSTAQGEFQLPLVLLRLPP